MGNRRHDITLIVCQNNDKKTLTVESVNADFLESRTGYKQEDLEGVPIQGLLPSSINEHIRDYVEFESMGNDLGMVLGKVRHFTLLGKGGKEIPFLQRIQPTLSEDKHLRFEITLEKERLPDEKLLALHQLRVSNKAHEAMGIPDDTSFRKEARLVQTFVGQGATQASLAVIAVNEFKLFMKKNGEHAAQLLLQDIVTTCRKTFREQDGLGYLKEGRFGVILMDVTEDNTQVALNRFRWQFGECDAGKDVTLTITHAMISDDQGVEALLEQCMTAAREHAEDNITQVLPA